MSPLAEKRCPSRSDRARPRSRERSRISVEPSVPAARIATVCGRYYAMDRDQRWERTDRAYSALTGSDTVIFAGSEPVEILLASYKAGVTDEFVEPVALEGRPRIGPNDAVIFFNFRPDRARQLSQRLLEAGADLTTMTRYRNDFDCPVVFGEQEVGEVDRLDVVPGEVDVEVEDRNRKIAPNRNVSEHSRRRRVVDREQRGHAVAVAEVNFKIGKQQRGCRNRIDGAELCRHRHRQTHPYYC